MLLSLYLQNLIYPNNESFSNEEPDGVKVIYLYLFGYSPRYFYKFTMIDYIFLAVFYMMALAISVYSAYLSYMCTWKGLVSNQFLRIFSAIFAFMLGPIYLVWYLLVNYLGKMC